MTTGIQQVYDKRGRVVQQMKDLSERAANEGRAMSAEEKVSFDGWDSDFEALTTTIKAHEQAETRSREMAAKIFEQPGAESGDKGKDVDYRSAWVDYFRFGENRMSLEQRKLLEQRGTNPQSVGTAALGGYLVPTQYQRELEIAMADYSGVWQVARQVRTDSGSALYWPTEDDTSGVAVLAAESAAYTVADIAFGQVTLDAYKYTTLAKITQELMRDSAFDIGGIIRDTFAARFGRGINAALTTGTGSGQPNGVVTASAAGVTAAGAAAITNADMINLFHSVDPAYRQGKSVGFMFHDNILSALKKISTAASDAGPMWMPSLREGTPDKYLGFPYWINQGMVSTIATTNKTALFGDFSKYIIRITSDMTIQRLDELYAANGQIGYIAFMRVDGDIIAPNAIKRLTQA